MAERDWNAHYEAGATPWDTGRPDEHLVALVDAKAVPAGRTLEIGCGTGTNALWLAGQGHEVTAVDLAPLAVTQARARAASQPALPCRFEALDFLTEAPPGGPFDFAFDRGCFHVFDEADVRARFAARVAHLLKPGGVWFSLVGSTEGPPRDHGPPRRSAQEIITAIEPVLQVVSLAEVTFEAIGEHPPPFAWRCLARRRPVE
jgi:SAM-dependent methyltransferase